MKREVALVLSSGSSRGLAHIGAIEALEQRGYHIHSVAGCSIGAIVGGMYAAGKLPELKQWFLDMDRKRMLSLTDFSVRMDHLVKGDRLMEAFASMGADTVIENLPKSLALIATDVNSGQEKVFTSGPLSLLIRASFSLPVVLQPVEYESMLLMDGGITNPLPLNRVRRKEGDLLVSLNVSAPVEPEQQRLPDDNDRSLLAYKVSQLMPTMQQLIDKVWAQKVGRHVAMNADARQTKAAQMNYISILSRISDIMVAQNAEMMKLLCPPDLSMEIPINHFGSYEYDNAGELIAYGYRLMNAEIDRFESLSC